MRGNDMDFIHLLNEAPIVWCREVWAYQGQPGWEAYSPFGEIKAFVTWEAANEWRISEIRECMLIGLYSFTQI
jgi:hypothetical protein